MKSSSRAWGVSLLALTLVLPCPGQQAPAKPAVREQSPIRIGTNEVLLDLVVVDKKGRPIRDLRADEIEVSEDGVRQTLTNFRTISDLAAQPVPAEEQPRHLVTILFDHLTVQRVQAVRSAAFQFIDNSVAANTDVRVMVVGRRLWLIEQFTRDKAKLRQAVELATYTVEKSLEERSQLLETALEQEVAAGGESASLASLSLETLRRSVRIEQELKSPHHIFSLIPFARAHRLMPGRKMAIYFSEGLYMPPGLGEVMRRTISEATMANLSFYSINTRDLLVGAGNQVSRLETATVVNQTRRAESSSYSTDNANSFGLAFGSNRSSTNFNTFEYIERKKEITKQGPLAELTEGTGGFLITNINDLNGALKRIGAEIGNYYAVSYQPTRTEADGRYRSIGVQVRRSGATVRARRGYFALPPAGGEVNAGRMSGSEAGFELDYEAPLLAALNGGIAPHDFAIRSAAFHFESQSGRTRVTVHTGLPLETLLPASVGEKKTADLSFAMLGLIRDEKGEVVQRFSEPHELSIPAAAIGEARRSVFNMTRQIWLAPGRYTFEAAIHDQPGKKMSVERHPLLVEVQPSPLQTSDILLIRQIEEIDPRNISEEHPLSFGNRRIAPHLTDHFSREESKEIAFTLFVYPAAGATEIPTLTIELLRGDRVVARSQPQLGPPESGGRIGFTAGLGGEGLVPGQYLLRATVRQGSEVNQGSTRFIIDGTPPPEPEEKTITSALSASDRMAELTLRAVRVERPLALSATDLITEAAQRGEQIHRELGQYTYALRKVRRILNNKGRIRREEYHDFEAYPINGRHALIRFAENGNRLAVQLIDLNRRTATEQLVKGEATKTTDRQIGYWGASLDGFSERRGRRVWSSLTIDPEIFFSTCKFSTPRIVMLDGRETAVLDFQPQPEAKPASDRAWVLRLAGSIWIDLADKALVRIEGASPAAPEGMFNFVYQQQILAPGVWAPALIRLNSAGDENIFDGFNWDAWFEFTQFRKFSTESSEKIMVK